MKTEPLKLDKESQRALLITYNNSKDIDSKLLNLIDISTFEKIKKDIEELHAN